MGEEGEEEGGEGRGRSARFTSSDLAMLPCTATSPAAQLYRSYRQKINTLKSMKAAELQHEIGALPPCHRFTYANRIQA